MDTSISAAPCACCLRGELVVDGGCRFQAEVRGTALDSMNPTSRPPEGVKSGNLVIVSAENSASLKPETSSPRSPDSPSLPSRMTCPADAHFEQVVQFLDSSRMCTFAPGVRPRELQRRSRAGIVVGHLADDDAVAGPEFAQPLQVAVPQFAGRTSGSGGRAGPRGVRPGAPPAPPPAAARWRAPAPPPRRPPRSSRGRARGSGTIRPAGAGE